jgi:hypothetical protein
MTRQNNLHVMILKSEFDIVPINLHSAETARKSTHTQDIQ